MLLAASAMLIVAGYQCSGTKNVTETTPAEIINTNINGKGVDIQLDFVKGKSFNYPLMAVWVEDTSGHYIETLYVSESIGKGIFQHGDKSTGHWQAGAVRRPAALPYWGHQRGIQAEDGLYIPSQANPMPDAITGPTPKGSFTLQSKSSNSTPQVFRILLEINQSWDWNEYWTNNKYPEDVDYKTSSQPSVVYAATIDQSSPEKDYDLLPIGHGHYAGKDGSLTTDLSTLTTALSIANSVKIHLE